MFGTNSPQELRPEQTQYHCQTKQAGDYNLILNMFQYLFCAQIYHQKIGYGLEVELNILIYCERLLLTVGLFVA